MNELKVTIPGVEVVGALNLDRLSGALSAILSRRGEKYGKEIAVTVTPSAQDERAARPARGRGKNDQRVSV